MRKGLQTNGIFIAFEGTDGCGKTTTLDIIKKKLAKTDIPLVYTKEPAGTELGEQIRDVLVDPRRHLTKLQQAELFMEAREDHLKKVILPAIADHKLIICDRYVLSSMAYQGDYEYNPYYLKPKERTKVLSKYSKADQELALANQCDSYYVDKNQILKKNKALPDFIFPNLNVYMQASPQTDIRRLSQRAEKSDKYDKALENLKSMRDLQKQYRNALKDLDTPHLLVNADDSPQNRADYILSTIMDLVDDKPADNVFDWVPSDY